MPNSELLTVGRLGSAHGVRGGIRVFSATEPPEQIFSYQPWWLKIKGQWQQIKLTKTNTAQVPPVVFIEGYLDRELVGQLAGAEIGVDRSQLEALPEGQFYWHELIGLEVHTVDGRHLGQVMNLMETGSNDVLFVKNGKEECLIPYLPGQVIKKIDLQQRLILVDWVLE